MRPTLAPRKCYVTKLLHIKYIYFELVRLYLWYSSVRKNCSRIKTFTMQHFIMLNFTMQHQFTINALYNHYFIMQHLHFIMQHFTMQQFIIQQLIMQHFIMQHFIMQHFIIQYFVMQHFTMQHLIMQYFLMQPHNATLNDVALYNVVMSWSNVVRRFESTSFPPLTSAQTSAKFLSRLLHSLS